MTPEHIKANLDMWVKDEAFHTIAGACGDLIREVERLRDVINATTGHIMNARIDLTTSTKAKANSALLAAENYARAALQPLTE